MDGFEPFEPLFTGQNPLRIAEHVKIIETIGFHAGRYWPLEPALWDIAGQVTGQPVSVLFGGAARRLPAYASFGEARSPQARAEAAVAAKAAGFRAMKIRIDRTNGGSSLAALRATREVVGDDIALPGRARPQRRRRLPERPRRPRPGRADRPRHGRPLRPLNPPRRAARYAR
jgi:L-alanine-DL-glutamate epimerase-like enolase superfamily enzyme